MRIKNLTDYDTQTAKELCRLASKGGRIFPSRRRIDVTIKKARKYNSGKYHGFLSRHKITIWLKPNFKRWREALVYLMAHEIYHVKQRTFGWKCSHKKADAYAEKVVRKVFGVVWTWGDLSG